MEAWSLTSLAGAFLFYAELFAVGASLALWLSAAGPTRVLALPRTALALVGFAATPLVVGVYVMALSLVPGDPSKVAMIAPVWVFILFTAYHFRRRLVRATRQGRELLRTDWRLGAVPAAALAVGAGFGFAPRYTGYNLVAWSVSLLVAVALAVVWRPARTGVPRGLARRINLAGRSWADYTLTVVGLAALIRLTQMLTTQLYRTHWAVVDGTQYLQEARYFLAHFSPSGWASLAASADGSVPGTTHNFTWSAYLAFSLEHTSGPVGYSHDAAAGAAFGFSAVCALAALGAVAAALRDWRAGVAGVAMLVVLPGFTYIIRAFSRDGFRLAGLLVCLVVVWGAARAAARSRRGGIGGLALCAAAGYYAVAAHPLNVLAGVGVAAGLVAWALAARCASWRFWALGGAAGLGAAGGMAGPLWVRLTGGSAEGDYVSFATIFAGTPYEANYQASRAAGVADTPTFAGRVWELMTGQPGGLMLLGAVAGIITLIGVARRGTPRLARASALLTAVPLLATLATVNDAINWYGHSMSQWYAMNLRYPFHLAVFAILAIMGLAHWLTTLRAPARASNRALSEAAHPQGQALSGEPGRAPDRASNRLRGREWGRPAARWMLVGIALLVFAVGQPYVMETVKVGWKLKPGAALAQTSGVLLVDSLQGAYLAAGPALSVFTPEARDILAAETVEELEAALDAHGITAIWSWRSYRLQYWKDAPLGEYLADPANFVAVDNKTPGPFPSATYPLYRLYERL